MVERWGRVSLAAVMLAGGERATRAALAYAPPGELRAELARRAREDVDDACARVGPRAAPGWLTRQLRPAPPSGLAGPLASPSARRRVIVDLRRAGLSIAAIAAKLHVSGATVSAALAATPAEQLPDWIVDRAGRRQPARRAGGTVAPVVAADATDVERAAVARQMHDDGASVRAIAAALDVGRYRATRLLAAAEFVEP